jgi:D-alanyl-D-alanine carboxypeptidase
MSFDLAQFWTPAIGIILLLLASLVIWRTNISRILDLFNVLSEGREWSSRLKTPEGLLEYIIAHPQDVSLVAYEIGNSQKGIFYNADEKRPLASTIKILILAEYARQVDWGILSPNELVNLSDFDIYYLPGTDGNAHPDALKELKTKGYINSLNQVELRQIAWAMIRFSDNAATDYLIERLGRNNLDKLVEDLELQNQDIPLPIIGQILAWSNQRLSNNFVERLNHYQSMKRKEYENEVYINTETWQNHQEFRAVEIKKTQSKNWLKFQEQQVISQALNCGGTAKVYALIMEKIYSSSLISPAADKIMRDHLEWQMEFAGNQQEIDAFGFKNGSLPGIITEACYLKPKKAKNARVFALFLENLQAGVWFQMLQNYVQQDFEYKLLGDESFFELVRQKLQQL